MADYTQNIDLPDHKLGDVWPGLAIGPITVDGGQPAETLARVRMQFRRGTEVFTIDSTASDDRDEAATITNATTWVASVAAISDFLPTAGKWAWDMQFYRTGVTAPWTLFKGDLTVHNHVTRL